MTSADALTVGILPALALLPERMDSIPAREMLVAIALQESGLKFRRQIRGPAKSLWQFEEIGVRGVMWHSATATLAQDVTSRLDYPFESHVIHQAIEHNDVLAAAFARLLLWTVPRPLPWRQDVDEALLQYLQAWRPGAAKDHRVTELRARWPSNWARAWEAVVA